MFKRKKKTPDVKVTTPISTHPEWARKVASPTHERVLGYLDKQSRLSPLHLFRSIRSYWLIAIFFNLVALGYLAASITVPLNQNLDNQVKLVRIDGKFIEESFDERRKVLVDNILRRVEIKASQSLSPDVSPAPSAGVDDDISADIIDKE